MKAIRPGAAVILGIAASLALGASSSGCGSDSNGGAPAPPAPTYPIACYAALTYGSDDANYVSQRTTPVCLCDPEAPGHHDAVAEATSCTTSTSAGGVAGALGVCCASSNWTSLDAEEGCSCEQMFCKIAGGDPGTCHCDDIPTAANEQATPSCPTEPDTVTCLDGTFRRQCYGARTNCPCGFAPIAGPCEAATVAYCGNVSLSGCTYDAKVLAPLDAGLAAPVRVCGSSASGGGGDGAGG